MKLSTDDGPSDTALQTREQLRLAGLTPEEVEAAIAALKPSKLRWYTVIALFAAALLAGGAWIIQGRRR